MLKINRKMSK